MEHFIKQLYRKVLRESYNKNIKLYIFGESHFHRDEVDGIRKEVVKLNPDIVLHELYKEDGKFYKKYDIKVIPLEPTVSRNNNSLKEYFKIRENNMLDNIKKIYESNKYKTICVVVGDTHLRESKTKELGDISPITIWAKNNKNVKIIRSKYKEIDNKSNLNESFLISDKTKIYRKEKIKENNIIMVVGLSGAGKSTLSKKLANKLNAINFSVDEYDRNWWKNSNPTWEELMEIEKVDYEKANKIILKTRNQLRKAMMIDIKKMAKKQLVIVDGLQLLEPLDDLYGKNWKCNYCFIVVGTSKLKAFFRGLKRDPIDALKNPIHFLQHCFFGTNKKVSKRMDEFIKEVEHCSDKNVEELNVNNEDFNKKQLILYHGSPVQNLKEISPRNNSSHDSQKINRVYATDDEQYAAAFTFPSTSDFCEISQTRGSAWTVKLDRRYKTLVMKPCSIYAVSSDGFKKVKYAEYTKETPTRVLKEEKFKTALECMTKCGVKIIWK